jgi:hypothetical protein
MLEMGYKQELHRGLGDFMNFAFGFTEVACLGSVHTLSMPRLSPYCTATVRVSLTAVAPFF